MTIRVYLVDDHALVRTGMKMILSGETDIEVVGEAETGEDALREVRQLLPDVVLCDLHLPGVSGMEVTERIVRSHRNTRVVIVSVLEDGPLPKRLLEAGAAGYIGKGCDAQELLRAVRDVAAGRRYLGTSIAQNLALSTVEGNGSPFDNLSPRELEVAPGPAPGRHRAAPEPECEDGEHAQGAVVREDGDPRQHRAGADGQPVRVGGSGTAAVRGSANG